MTKATDTFGIVLKSSVRECTRLRAAIDEFVETNKFPAEEGFKLQACLQDALMSIAKHGLGDTGEHDIDIQMLFQRKRRILTLRVAYDATRFDAVGENSPPDRSSQVQSQLPDAPHLCSVRRYADQVSCFRQGRYNHLILSRIIPERPNSPAAAHSA